MTESDDLKALLDGHTPDARRRLATAWAQSRKPEPDPEPDPDEP